MKTKRAIHIGVLVGAAMTIGYLLAYRHSSSPGKQRLNCASNLKQIGFPFRMGRNDVNAQISLTGSVVVPKIQTDER